MRVEVEDGKYTVILHPDGKLEALRCGEPWRDLTGDKMVYCLAAEIETLRRKVQQAQSAADMNRSWVADADSQISLLRQHLRAVLEIAETWQPDYATQMDLKTLEFAKNESPAVGLFTPHEVDAALEAWFETPGKGAEDFPRRMQAALGAAHGCHVTTQYERLRKFLDVAAGEGYVLGGVDAADLYIALFPKEYADA